MLEFIKEGLPVSYVQGFDNLIVLAHAYHESGGFIKIIGNWNVFGIKKPSSWKGKIVDVTTHEYIKGKKVKVIAPFIDFDTVGDLVMWYTSLIKRLYPNAYDNRKNPGAYFKGLINGKYQYATDPNYPIKLMSVYNRIK